MGKALRGVRPTSATRLSRQYPHPHPHQACGHFGHPLVEAVPLVGSLADVLGQSAAPLARMLWSRSTDAASALIALDRAARHAPLLAPLYSLAELEQHLVAPAKFVVAALAAFKEEVDMHA